MELYVFHPPFPRGISIYATVVDHNLGWAVILKIALATLLATLQFCSNN